MSDKKTILVTGVTGAQGGSVAQFLLKDGKFNVKCLTRNADSDAAKALAEAGSEVVKGDFDNIDSLNSALEGVWGVFGVTNFWEHFDKEFQQGKNLSNAVNNSNAEYFIYSSLPDIDKLSKSKYDVPHFQLKAQLEDYIEGLDVKHSFVHAAFYYENFLSYFPPQKQEDGSYGFGFPQGNTLLAGICIADLGGIVKEMFNSPEQYYGKTVGGVGDDLTGTVYAKTMSNALGREVGYSHIPQEVFASFGFPGADDLANMFAFNAEFIPNRKEEMDQARSMYPGLKTFETWMSENKDQFSGFFE